MPEIKFIPEFLIDTDEIYINWQWIAELFANYTLSELQNFYHWSTEIRKLLSIPIHSSEYITFECYFWKYSWLVMCYYIRTNNQSISILIDNIGKTDRRLCQRTKFYKDWYGMSEIYIESISYSSPLIHTIVRQDFRILKIRLFNYFIKMRHMNTG